MASAPQAIEVLKHQVLQAAQIIEEKLDEEIKELDDLKLDDIELLRQRRLQELKKIEKLKRQYKEQGHGEYTELKDQTEFFAAVKKSSNVVVHFYNSFVRCGIVDNHLKVLTRKHLETKFCKIRAENSLFLAEKLVVKIIPTILLIKDGIVKDRIVGFTDLGNCDDFSTDILEWRIALSGVIDYEGDLLHPPENQRLQKVNNTKKTSTIKDCNNSDSDDDDSD